jgi:hypothetical protein
MESEQELHSTFSTLNVNAVEFVPSFGGAVVKDPESASEEPQKAVVETPENNGNGEFCGDLLEFDFASGKKIATSNVVREREMK